MFQVFFWGIWDKLVIGIKEQQEMMKKEGITIPLKMMHNNNVIIENSMDKKGTIFL